LAIDDRQACAADHIKPLIGPAVAVVRAPLGLAGGQRHLRRLRELVGQQHAKTAPELQVLVLHASSIFLSRNLRALFSRLRQADGNGLLSALGLLASLAALLLAALRLVQRFLHFAFRL